MSNRYIETVADEYGDVDAQIKALEERKKALRDELVTLVQDVPVVGLRWTVTRSDVTSRRLDTKLVEAYLGERAEEFKKATTSVQLRVKQTQVLGRKAEDAK